MQKVDKPIYDRDQLKTDLIEAVDRTDGDINGAILRLDTETQVGGLLLGRGETLVEMLLTAILRQIKEAPRTARLDLCHAYIQNMELIKARILSDDEEANGDE